MRILLVLSILLNFIYMSPAALASHSTDCDIKLHMFNKLNMKKVRTFSGRADYIFIDRKISENSVYQKLNSARKDICNPEISGDIIHFPMFISSQLSSKITYIATLYFQTGKYNVNNSDIKFLKSSMKSASGLLIVGRASAPGTKAANRQLSERRALEVANYFTEITSATVIALGDEQTREELDNPHHDNRRVDIYAYQ